MKLFKIIKNQTQKIIILALFIGHLNNVFCQEKIISGIVIDSLENPIRYANVGFINQYIGTVTNEKGEFLLKTKSPTTVDTLRISCIGFKTIDLAIDNSDKKNYNFRLEHYTEKLKEVNISSRKLKTYSIGKEKTKSKSEVFFTSPKSEDLILGSEIGRLFSIGTKKPSALEGFKFFIKDNNFEKTKFRINIYTIENNLPSKKINTSNIFVEVGNQLKGWVEVDLSKYNINVQQDIIITVEWIEAAKPGNILGLPIFIPSFSSTYYYRYSAQYKWRKYNMISSAMVLTYKQ